MQSLRSKGYSSLKDIDAVMLETNGDILVYKQSRNERYLFNPTRCQDGLNTLPAKLLKNSNFNENRGI